MRKSKIYFDEDVDISSMINLTPLLDVLFVVLVFFIIVAPLLEHDRINLADDLDVTSNKQSVQMQDMRPIKIFVDSNNQITMENEPINIRQLRLKLKKIYELMPGEIPQLFQDKNAKFGTYQTIKNALEAAGFQEMDVIVKSS